MSDLNVRRDVAVAVLRENNVNVTENGEEFTVEGKGLPPEVHVWDSIELSSRALGRLVDRYGIPKQKFTEADKKADGHRKRRSKS